MLESNQTRATSANLFHQLLQREMNIWPQNTPRTFAGQLYTERYRLARNLFKTDLRAHYGCVNAIEFSHGGKYLASGGDDKRVLIWDVEKAISGHGRPRVLHTEHTSNIFCLGFDRSNGRVFSGGNDDLVIVHDFETGKLVNVFKHDNPVYGLSIDPQSDSVFATACEDGQILVFDQRTDSADPLVVAQLRTSFHAVEFHPAGSNFLVTANSKRGAAFWDIRKPHHPVIQYGGHVEDPPSCMSVRFNTNGSLILALRRRLPPILYNTQSPEPVCTFYHGNYYNSCTMKSCTFAGENDEFVLSGSDDFNLYVWRVSDVDLERTDQWVETTQMVLYGHRSIVNQVRYNRQKCLLASSGVEKVVKLWSPFAQKDWAGSLLEEATCSDNPRELYSPYNFASMSTPPHSWSHMSHDYSSRNTSEDPRMMAFFDSLIQQEIEGWETNSSTDSPLSSDGSRSCSSSNDSSDSSLDDDDDDDDDDGGDDGRVGGGASNVHAGISAGERTARHVKRHLVRRKEYKHRKSVLRKKVKLQRHKYANRIAYLIATKRSRLRRLAIKGASLNDRRPFKVVKVGRTPKHVGKTMRTRASKRHATHRLSLTRRSNLAAETSSVAIASTSTASASSAANTTGASGYRFQRRKYKKHCACDTSSDDGRGASNAAPAVPNNAPSTSTGITTTLIDEIIRLRQQQQHIIDSDEYDDDESISPSSHQVAARSSVIEVIVDPTVSPKKKLNGVRRANDAAVMERSSRGEPSVNTAQAGGGGGSVHSYRNSAKPATSGVVSDTRRRSTNDSASPSALTSTPTATTTTTILPQTSTDSSCHALMNGSNGTCHNPSSSSSSNINNSNTIAASSSSSRCSRRRPYLDLMDNYSSHSNSRLSNSSYQDDLLDSSSNDASAQAGHDGQYSTPIKRRKLGGDGLPAGAKVSNHNRHNEHDYPIRTGSTERTPPRSNHTVDEFAAATATQLARKQTRGALSSNNNNNNNCNSNSSNRREMSQPQAPEQQTQFENESPNNRLNAPLLQTPDSGISIATTSTSTPSLGCRNTDSSGHWRQGSSGLENGRTPNGDATSRLLSLCDENANAPLSLFQQKVARVRRNYRQKFADDESDDSD